MHSARLLFLLALVALVDCGSPPQFPMREAFTRDTDLDPIRGPCRRRPSEKDPEHVSCAPDLYVSPLAWDAADNTLFRPLAKIFAVDPPD